MFQPPHEDDCPVCREDNDSGDVSVIWYFLGLALIVLSVPTANYILWGVIS